MPSGAGKGTAVPSTAHTSLLRATQSPRPAVSSQVAQATGLSLAPRSPWFSSPQPPPGQGPCEAPGGPLQGAGAHPGPPITWLWFTNLFLPLVGEGSAPTFSIPSGCRVLLSQVALCRPRQRDPAQPRGRHVDSVLEKLLRSGGRNWPAHFWGGAQCGKTAFRRSVHGDGE